MLSRHLRRLGQAPVHASVQASVWAQCAAQVVSAWVRFVEGNRGLAFGADKSLFGSWSENVSEGESRAPRRVFYFVFSGNDLQLLATTL